MKNGTKIAAFVSIVIAMIKTASCCEDVSRSSYQSSNLIGRN